MSVEERFNPFPPLSVQKQVKGNPLPLHSDSQAKGRFPSWLHRNLPKGKQLAQTSSILAKYQLNTVCEEAKCPNRFECYSNKTATFLALGHACTRNCGFCDIDFSKQPHAPQKDEPMRIALSVKELGLRHVVITMVARDDLEDGGSEHLAQIMQQVRAHNPGVAIEVLTSDFQGKFASLDRVLDEHPEVFNHNIETVRLLTPRVRHRATYDQTLAVLRYAKASGKTAHIKSGLMVGLGETEEQVAETLTDLKDAGCDIVTMGQYLQPNRRKLLVKSFIPPEQFERYAALGRSIGIKYMYCGPFVRSSYHAHEAVQSLPS